MRRLLAHLPHVHRARRTTYYADGTAVDYCRCGRWCARIPGRHPGRWFL